MSEGQTAQLQGFIDRLRAGDVSARDELIRSACDRLLRLTHKMLRTRFARVARWEQTEDVFQSAILRLCRALNEVVPESARHFLRLAAEQIRRELTDLARHHYGPHGTGRHHLTGDGEDNDPAAAALQTTLDPVRLAQWGEFHEQVAALPAEEREVFDLLWYHDIPQAEAAALLGLSERTLQRRWQSARLKLFDALKGALPE